MDNFLSKVIPGIIFWKLIGFIFNSFIITLLITLESVKDEILFEIKL